MKLLLVAINAKYIHSNLAVYSLKAYAGKYAKHCKIAEYTINHSEEDILSGIYREQADVIAFSCYIWNIEMITRIITELKKVQPKAVIWFGGPEVSYDVQQCLMLHQGLDGIIIGEGEQTFLELVKYYVEGNTELSSIAGIAYKEEQSKQIIVTADRPPLNLNDLPFPYENPENFQNKIIYYESSRGCPFSCSYCLSSIDRRVRIRDTRLVEKELMVFLDLQVPQVKFVDRTFNCNKEHAMAIWQFIKDKDNGITNFHFEISADLLTEEQLTFLSTLRPGQVQFEIGVQTTNADTIEVIHRRTDFDKLSHNVRRIKEGNNIHQHLDLIAGLPLEGYDSFEKSFNDVYGLQPDQLQLGFLKVLKGSRMGEDSKAYGIAFRDTAPYEVLFTGHLKYEELVRIKGICEMVEIYYNSGQFVYSIKYLEHYYTSYMKLYQDINSYYEEKGLNLLAHGRIRRYEILLDFYKERLYGRPRAGQERLVDTSEAARESEPTLLFEEILLLDLYLREKLKGRPSFARKVSDNSLLRGHYERAKKELGTVHIEAFSYDVVASSLSGRAVRKDTLLLFDYNDRDPLNKSAKIKVLD